MALCSPLRGQTPEELSQKWQEKYPKSNGVFLTHQKEITIDYHSKKGVTTSSVDTYEKLLFNTKAKRYSTSSIYTSSFVESSIIDAYSSIPSNGKYKKVKVDDFTEAEDFGNGIFYNDSKRISFKFSGITENAKTYYSYKTNYIDPRFLGSFYFNSFLPIVESKLVIYCDKNVEIKWKTFGTETENIEYSATEDRKYTVHKWVFKDVPVIRMGAQSPASSYLSPHIQFRIANIKTDTGRVAVLNTIADLNSWYATFIDSLATENWQSLQPLSDSIVAGTTSEFEKVKAIYYWVQSNIRYVAFEDGLGGFIPRPAELVCQRKFGDCKDMSHLLFSLLKCQGIKGHHTWIGSRVKPYKYSEFPSPLIDNHMICTYYDSVGTPHFLDATANFLSIYQPNSFIQGKEALVQFSKDSFRIETVPTATALQNSYLDTFSITIREDLKVEGTGSAYLGGYMKNEVVERINTFTSEKKDRYFQSLFSRGSDKSHGKLIATNNLTERDLPLKLTYEFGIEDYLTAYENEVYLNPHLFKDILSYQLDEEEHPHFIEQDYKQLFAVAMSITPPPGFKIKQLPESRVISNDVASYKVNYSMKNDQNSALVTIEYEEKFILLPEQAYPDYQTILKELNHSFSELIIFEKL